METDKTPQEQCSVSKDNEAHTPETENKSFVDQITTTEGNKHTTGSSEDNFYGQNREGETVKFSEENATESKTEDTQAASSSNLEQESTNASATYAKKGVETATHADDLIDPKPESTVSKNTLTKTEPCKDNDKSNLTIPSDTPSNLTVSLNESGQKQVIEKQPNKDECHEFESTKYVTRNEIRTDNERDDDNDNNINKDTKGSATDKIDGTPRLFTPSLEDYSSGKERDNESSNDQQTYLTEVQQNQFSESQTQTRTIDETTYVDRQESKVKTEPDKTTDNENYQDNFTCSDSAKREHSEQNMVPKYNQTGGTQIADPIATDDKVEQDTLCQINVKPWEKAEVPHDDSLTHKLAGEEAQLSSKQVNSGIPDSEDEASSFHNKFDSLDDDIEVIQKDELENEKNLSSNLQEEIEVNLKDELEKEKKLSSKQKEAYERQIGQMEAELRQREEQLEKANKDIIKRDDVFYQMEKEHADRYTRLQEENNTNIAKMESMQDQARKNELLNKSLTGEVTQLKLDKQSSATTIKQLTSQVENKDKILDKLNLTIHDLNKSLSKEKEKLKEEKSQHSKRLKSEQNLEKNNRKLREAYDRQAKEYVSTLEDTKNHYERCAKEQSQYWEAIAASLNEKMNLQAKSHDALLLRYSKLAGESLTMGNANVTDLSDPSRPTKLAEQFSELYDNEWTDAFEELESASDSEKINYLLIILQRAYELSSDITTSEWLSRCYYRTFRDYKHFGISVCGEDFEDSTNSYAKGEDTDRSKQTFTSEAHEPSRDSNGDTKDITDPTNIGTNKENTGQTEQSTKNDAHKHPRDSNGDNTYLSDSTNSDAKEEDIDRSKQTLTNDAHEHSRDSSGDTTDITDRTNIGTNKEDTGQTEQSTKKDGHKHTRDSNGDNTYLSDPTQADQKRENVHQTGQSIANDAQEHSRDSGGDTTDFNTKEQQTADNNEIHDEEDSVSGTDFQDGSSVDPPSETNKDNTQNATDGTSVDPVTDMPLVNKETVRAENLNLLVVEVPDEELKNEREQMAMKVFPHLKKKVLSCASDQLQKVITDCLMKEFNVPTEATNLVKFVEKCGELCLKMGLKDPPLHIDFIKEGIPDQTHFNAEQYKAYTKKGKYLHYVVWPCLFLEKDGPLLCKGTAQGRPD